MTDEMRIHNGLIEQTYYNDNFNGDDISEYYKERGKIKRERYLSQLHKIQEMPDSTPLEQCAKLRKYYGLAWRYNKNFHDYLYDWNPEILQNFIKIGVLKPYKDTVWFNKDKLSEFEEFVSEVVSC